MKKDCKKCKYFVQHYAVGKTGLVEADCGHCKFPVSANRFKEPKQPCQNFEAKDFALQLKEKRQTISSTLQSIDSKLKKLLEYVRN